MEDVGKVLQALCTTPVMASVANCSFCLSSTNRPEYRAQFFPPAVEQISDLFSHQHPEGVANQQQGHHLLYLSLRLCWRLIVLISIPQSQSRDQRAAGQGAPGQPQPHGMESRGHLHCQFRQPASTAPRSPQRGGVSSSDSRLKAFRWYSTPLQRMSPTCPRPNCALIQREEARLMALPAAERRRALAAVSPVVADLMRNEGTYMALEQLYTRDGIRFNGLEGVDDGGVARIWFECDPNARAIRERKTSTVRLLVDEIVTRSDRFPGHPVEVAGIAAASGRCVIEMLRRVPESCRVRARLLDSHRDAVRYSQRLAEEYGVSDRIEAMPGDVLRFRRCLAGRPVHLAEAVGIMDYLEDRVSVFFLRQVHSLLEPGGQLVVSNIMPNPNQEFLHTVVGWRPMHYRTAEDLADLLMRAGFEADGCTVHEIPTRDLLHRCGSQEALGWPTAGLRRRGVADSGG